MTEAIIAVTPSETIKYPLLIATLGSITDTYAAQNKADR